MKQAETREILTDRRPRPPKGWLYGVLLTILLFWVTGIVWQAFRAHEISFVSFAGGAISILATVLIAHQALTNEGYRTSKGTFIARRVLLPLGILVYIVGHGF